MPLDTKLNDILLSFPVKNRDKKRQWKGEEELVDLQIGRTCWHMVERKMRTELWLSVLHRHRLKTAAASYPTMLERGMQLPEEVAFDIEKDVNRTFPEVDKFANGKGVQSLMNVLKAYAALDPEVGYCQGMNFLAGVLLMYLPQEEDAYSALVLLMQHRKLRELYKEDLAMLQVKLWQVGRLMPQQLALHMEERCCLPVLYMSAWLLTGFASSFPLPFASRVMDVLLTDSYSEPTMKVSLAIMKACQPRLMEMREMEEMVEYLKDEVPALDGDRLQEILTEALSQPWSLEQAAILEETAGSVSVLDAVKANEADVLSGAAAARCVNEGREPSPPLTPTIMAPLPPPPKWAARGSAQLGALVASPARVGNLQPAPRPGSISRRSVAGVRAGGSRRNSQMTRPVAEEFGSFRNSAAGGTDGVTGLLPPPRSAVNRSAAASVRAGNFVRQQSRGEEPQRQSSGEQPGAVRPILPPNRVRGSLDSDEENTTATMSASPPRSGGVRQMPRVRPPGDDLRRIASDRPADLLSASLAQLGLKPSNGAAPVRRAPSGGGQHTDGQRSASTGLLGSRTLGRAAGATSSSLRPSSAGAALNGTPRASDGGSPGGNSSLGSRIFGHSSATAPQQTIFHRTSFGHSPRLSPQKSAPPASTTVTRSMPTPVMSDMGPSPSSQGLRSPGGSAELSSTDFAALLASGMAGIAAVPYSCSFTGASASSAPQKRSQPLDAAAFGGDGSPHLSKQPLPLLGRPAGVVARDATKPAAPASTTRSTPPSPATLGLDPAAVKRSREATNRVAAQMAVFEDLAGVSRSGNL